MFTYAWNVNDAINLYCEYLIKGEEIFTVPGSVCWVVNQICLMHLFHFISIQPTLEY